MADPAIHDSEVTIAQADGKLESGKEPKSFILYKRRHVVLLVLCLALFSNGEAWMTYSTVATQSQHYFRRSSQDIGWFSNVFLLAYAVEAIPCTFMPQLIGLKWTLIAGCGLNLGGILFRLISVVIPDHDRFLNFMIAMVGNAIFGLGQGFLLNIPALVSSRWFGERERAVSTSVAYMSNAVGVGVGFFDIFEIMGDKNTDSLILQSFRNLVFAQTVLIVFTFVLSVIFVKESPPTVPSASEEKKLQNQKEFHFLASLKKMLRDMVHILGRVDSCVALYIYSVYYAMYVFTFMSLYDIITDFTRGENSVSGYIGSIGIVLSGVSSVIVGLIMDKTGNKYNRKIGVGVNFLCFLPLAIFTILVAADVHTVVSTFVLLLIYLNFSAVYVAIGSEILADVTYPMDPNVSTNEGLVIGNIIGCVFYFSLGQIKSVRIRNFIVLSLAIAVYALNCLLMMGFKLKKNRQAAEKVVGTKSSSS